ncbi:hypothetical protein OAI65_03690 [Candidatus Poseidoniales archaeon]|nr:hypothetical protein [Candidatus Poseidoniales archaeon]
MIFLIIGDIMGLLEKINSRSSTDGGFTERKHDDGLGELSFNLEEFIIEIEENESGSFFIFQRQVASGGPMKKILSLLFAILLIPVCGLGIYLIWNTMSMGPINEHTTTIVSKIYSKKHHSIIDYRLILDQENVIHKIARSKVSPIGDNAIIELNKIWSDQMGGHRVSCWIKSDKKPISLPYFESDSSVIGSGIEELFVGARLEEFARFANLKIVSD